MIVYTPGRSDGYELCHPMREEDFETIHLTINGEPRASEWKPIEMRLIRVDEGRALKESDSPWLGSHALIFRGRAIAALGQLLTSCGELLPLSSVDPDLHVFNPTRVVDALDHSASSMTRFDDGRILRVSRYAFRSESLRGVSIFKIPDLRVSPTFVSQDVVEAWNRSRLVGLEFKRVWSNTDAGPLQ